LAGRSPSTRRLEAHATELPAIPMRLEIAGRPPTSTWRVLIPSWAYVEAEVIRSCLEFLEGPARSRLRRCQNEDCLWAFVDASRNGSRRWCDPEICGNVAKVRAYRQRQKGS
jgi:predicted RNA-binding Zn ribbon-like protein